MKLSRTRGVEFRIEFRRVSRLFHPCLRSLVRKRYSPSLAEPAISRAEATPGFGTSGNHVVTREPHAVVFVDVFAIRRLRLRYLDHLRKTARLVGRAVVQQQTPTNYYNLPLISFAISRCFPPTVVDL